MLPPAVHTAARGWRKFLVVVPVHVGEMGWLRAMVVPAQWKHNAERPVLMTCPFVAQVLAFCAQQKGWNRRSRELHAGGDSMIYHVMVMFGKDNQYEFKLPDSSWPVVPPKRRAALVRQGVQ